MHGCHTFFYYLAGYRGFKCMAALKHKEMQKKITNVHINFFYNKDGRNQRFEIKFMKPYQNTNT